MGHPLFRHLHGFSPSVWVAHLWHSLVETALGQVRGNALCYGRSLVFSDLDLTSVLPVERSEANAAISIITNITMAVSQIEPANMSSGGSV